MSRKPIKILNKPPWMKIKLPIDANSIKIIKENMRNAGLYSVCEEASCPNISNCFHRGVATFMILGKICTRRCPFCNIRNGRPQAVDAGEPIRLSETIAKMKLKYVVITSVNRDDLYDGGAQQFSNCITEIYRKNPLIKIEILVPDFRKCMKKSLEILHKTPPDIFNHNIENVPRIYHKVRPGANYISSLKLLQYFKELNPHIPTKSGLMLGLGETHDEIIQVMNDLRCHGVSMLTLGQYLQPSKDHLPVQKYIHPDEFYTLKQKAYTMGFTYAACGPFMRSSYHAEDQAEGIEIK